MLHTLLKTRSLVGHRFSPWRQCFSTSGSRRSSDPLRILFCGSDEFSCVSLKAVHEEHTRPNGVIESLDVMVFPPKRYGRGLKRVREVPCKQLAEDLDLRIHQRDTFREWELPEGTNLVVAVSFGLFVPPRILKSAKYGGLNLHPSLLPDLRGPAPVHHSILHGRTHTGVSLQTLDDKAFDHGTVLAQTPAPGIPISPTIGVDELISQLAPVGAQMLVQGLRDGVYLPPHQDAGWKGKDLEGQELVHAPKVTKADAEIDWDQWTGDEFVRRSRVLGTVWTQAVDKKRVVRRLILKDVEVVSHDVTREQKFSISFVTELGEGEETVKPERSVFGLEDGSCIIPLSNGEQIRVGSIKEGGKLDRSAASFLRWFCES
ncbi:formyl transferase [Thelonectria olida]|uniref:methionyl-tRNA formyltransferase n=1 Tax=Thelonectria olida TaxID=1576542 RepID=A0A9P8WI14_9HYPO|nr:formyl transferase [Thelonectria olida]